MLFSCLPKTRKLVLWALCKLRIMVVYLIHETSSSDLTIACYPPIVLSMVVSESRKAAVVYQVACACSSCSLWSQTVSRCLAVKLHAFTKGLVPSKITVKVSATRSQFLCPQIWYLLLGHLCLHVVLVLRVRFLKCECLFL